MDTELKFYDAHNPEGVDDVSVLPNMDTELKYNDFTHCFTNHVSVLPNMDTELKGIFLSTW